MKIVKIICIIIILTSCKSQEDGSSYSGVFEGTEPFWRLELDNGKYELDIQNKTLTGNFIFSNKASRGKTISFQDKDIFGFINQSPSRYCDYAITDEDSLSYEVFLHFKKVAYKGCGNLEE